MPTRPLWRTPTKEAITQANAALSIQRAQLADMPIELILEEVARRGLQQADGTTPFAPDVRLYDAQERRWYVLCSLGDDDIPFDGGDRCE